MVSKIAFQGSFGANSDLACRQFYPNLQTIACSSFDQVFDMVTKGQADYGMIPLENSYAGRVAEIHNLLHDINVSVVAEHFLRIGNNLAAIKGTKISDIKEVYSHPQALMQCRGNLAKTNFKQIPFSNTAEAAKFIANAGDHSKAAICSELAAKINNLEIIRENWQDSDNNLTLFVVISKRGIDPDPKNGKVLTTMLFTVRNIPGALYKCLGGLATNNVNMVKLESYIPSGDSKQAKFFISIEGHPSQSNVSLALEEMGFFSKSVKVLGVYSADKTRFKDSE